MKPKAEIMARLRKERAAAGLVELRLWLTPEHREAVKAYADRIAMQNDAKSMPDYRIFTRLATRHIDRLLSEGKT